MKVIKINQNRIMELVNHAWFTVVVQVDMRNEELIVEEIKRLTHASGRILLCGAREKNPQTTLYRL
jgi:hypothetical protein